MKIRNDYYHYQTLSTTFILQNKWHYSFIEYCNLFAVNISCNGFTKFIQPYIVHILIDVQMAAHLTCKVMKRSFGFCVRIFGKVWK